MTVAATPGRAGATVVLITVLLDAMALGMMLPALPKLVAGFVPDDPVRAAELVGWIAGGWGAMQLVGSPILGALSDRYGRRPIILAANLGLALDYALMAFAPTLWWLVVGRLIGGFTGSTFATVFAYVADVTPPADRAAAFGRIGATFGVGFVLGPAVGGLLAEVGPRVPFEVATVVCLVNALYGVLVLPESLAPENRMAFAWSRANPFGSLRLLARTARLRKLAVVNLLDALALVSLPATFVLYASATFAWSDLTIGLNFAAIGLAIAVVQGGLTGPIVARLGERRTLLAALLFGIAGFCAYGLAPSSLMLWAAIPLLALWGLADGPVQAMMSREVSPSEYGQLQGALAALAALAEMIGPVLFTQVYAVAIGPGAGVLPAGSPFLLAAGLQSIGLAVAVVALRGSSRASP